jgi:hypothetical protein
MKADARKCTQMLHRCRHHAWSASLGSLALDHLLAALYVIHSTPMVCVRRTITRSPAATAQWRVLICVHWRAFAFICGGIFAVVPQTPGQTVEGSDRFGTCCITLAPQRKPRTGSGGCKYFSANESKCTPMHANAASMPAPRV